MNIVGEGFADEIIDQINVRQEIYGSINRTNEQLTFLNSRTGWVKMVSSVNVTQPGGIRGIAYTGDELAKNFILFNGTTSTISGVRSGVWNGLDSFDNFAYGLGGTEFGLRPMPGITSAEIKTETRGSLKTATIRVKAYNRQQFDIIDLLYMRLGYSILLEWGNSSYFETKDKYISNNPYSLANDFLNGTLKYDTYLKTINDKRLESKGNYDAIIGKVVNFNWNFEADGSYTITIILRSMGDVIESLKTNILLPGNINPTSTVTNPAPPPPEPNPTPEQVIKSFENAHEIGKEFYKQQQILASAAAGTNGLTYSYSTDNAYTGYDNNENDHVYVKQVYEGGETQYYVKLAYFLKFLEKYIIPYVDNDNVKLLKINNRVNSNIIYVNPLQVSCNPGICTFNKDFIIGSSRTLYRFFPGQSQFIFSEIQNEKLTNTYGYLMNVYFNMVYILTELENLKDDTGRVSLYDLLLSLCKGFCNATGNVNSIEPTVNAETGEIILTDQTALPDRDKILEKLGKSTKNAIFNVYGLYLNEKGSSTSGFIRDLSFTTTVPSNLATMITVGSTKNGYVLGADSTALSRMNNGLEDRFKKEIKNTSVPETATTSSLETDYQESIKAFNTFVSEISNGINGNSKPKWNEEAITAFTNTQTNFLEYNQAKQTQANQNNTNTTGSTSNAASPNSGFLPFDLSITMDGLSGMKVYQKYTIDTSFLPSNYPESLEFIIKGISNRIENNQWTTTLESFAIPKNPFGAQSIEDNTNTISPSSRSRGESQSPTGPIQYYQSNLPEAQAKFRVRLTRILDDGTQTLGIIEVYNADASRILYSLASVELPWKENANGSSCIPTGEYLVNSRQTSKYGKHFWLVGSKLGNWQRIPGTNKSDREWVLIHTAPKAPGWLAGCIGPGPQYDFNRKNKQGNPDGVGTNYLNPAKAESKSALDTLVSTLYNEKGFKMIIENLDGVPTASLPKSINDPKIKKLAADARFKSLFKDLK